MLVRGAENADLDRVMDEITATAPQVPADWLETLTRSDAELSAGLTVPAEVVHRRIRDCIARIEDKRAGGEKREVIRPVD